MTFVTNANELRTEIAPLYHQYSRQYPAQPAYISIDPENNSVIADWSGAIGGGCSMDVWNGNIIEIPVNNQVSGDAIASFLESEEFSNLVLQIYAGYSVEWDGSNYIGVLDDEAQKAREDIVQLVEKLNDYSNLAQIVDIEDWLEPTLYKFNDKVEIEGMGCITKQTTDQQIKDMATIIFNDFNMNMDNNVYIEGVFHILKDCGMNAKMKMKMKMKNS